MQPTTTTLSPWQIISLVLALLASAGLIHVLFRPRSWLTQWLQARPAGPAGIQEDAYQDIHAYMRRFPLWGTPTAVEEPRKTWLSSYEQRYEQRLDRADSSQVFEKHPPVGDLLRGPLSFSFTEENALDMPTFENAILAFDQLFFGTSPLRPHTDETTPPPIQETEPLVLSLKAQDEIRAICMQKGVSFD